MSITHGSVTFNRRRNTGDYSHKDATVTLHFDSDDDRNKAAALAEQTALSMTGEPATNWVGNLSAASRSTEGRYPEPTPDIMGNGVAENPTTPATSTAIDAPDPVSVPIAEAAFVTDEQLNKAVTDAFIALRKAQDTPLKAEQVPVLFAKLIAEYAPPPKKASAIPQEQRAEFLKRLTEVKVP